MGHHFLSYARPDEETALKLCDELEAGPPAISVWIDRRDEVPGLDWDTQIVEAIRACESLLFLMTPDSVDDTSGCKQEWTRALKYKKPIVPIRLRPDAELPYRLEPRQFIDFSASFDAGLARLRKHLAWLASPAGALQSLKDRLADARRDLRRVRDPHDRQRIEEEIAELQRQVAQQQGAIEDPRGTAKRVEERIARGQERERQPERPLVPKSQTKFVNPPPMVAPAYFQDRQVETRLLGEFLRDESRRLIMVVGRGGIGKTALVCRLLRALESGRLPDDGGELPVDGIVYLSAVGGRRFTLPNLYADFFERNC